MGKECGVGAYYVGVLFGCGGLFDRIPGLFYFVWRRMGMMGSVSAGIEIV